MSGFYRYTRNPMYVAVVSAIVGQALLFGSSNLLAYAVLIWLLVSSFVIVYEEPVLGRKFGRPYGVYRDSPKLPIRESANAGSPQSVVR